MNGLDMTGAAGGGLLTGVAWGTAPDWIVALTAILGAIFAIQQIRRVAEANKTQVSVARAELILDIDGRFESIDMVESRLAIRTLRNHCETVARRSSQFASNDEQLTVEIARLFSAEVTDLWHRYKSADPIDASRRLTEQSADADGPLYFKFMRLPYWAETVASLVHDGLLPREDVRTLFDAVYTGTLRYFEEHIRHRQGEGPLHNDRFLANAIRLMNEFRAEDAARRDAVRRQEDRRRDRRRGNL